MPLGKHTKTEYGRFRKERSDSLIGNLAKEYLVLNNLNPRMKLGTLEKKLEVESLDEALKILKKKANG